MGKSREKKKSLQSAEGEVYEGKAKAGTAEILDVKIKAVTDNTDQKTAPMLGYFPSGYDPLKKVSDASSSRVKIYRNVKSRNPKNPRMQLVVGVNGSKVNFVGTNYSGEATTPQLCNYALGVFDKESRTLRMVPIAGNRIFRLEPNFEALDLPEDEDADESNKNLSLEEKDDKFRELTYMYSTKKDIRRDKKREALRQSEGQTGTPEEMDQKLKGVEVNKEAIKMLNSTVNAQNIPPYNLDATSPDMAYPLDQIILREEWDYLLDIFELAKSGTEMDPKVYPCFVCNRYDKLGHLEDESKKRRLAGILSYITHLVKLKDKHSMDGVSSAKRHKFPGLLSQKFSSMFGCSSNSRLQDDKRRLLINYVLVLSLFADDFQTDPSDIAKDLRMDTITLRTHYEYLGCKFVRQNQVFHATLPVPLQFKTIKRKRRK